MRNVISTRGDRWAVVCLFVYFLSEREEKKKRTLRGEGVHEPLLFIFYVVIDV